MPLRECAQLASPLSLPWFPRPGGNPQLDLHQERAQKLTNHCLIPPAIRSQFCADTLENPEYLFRAKSPLAPHGFTGAQAAEEGSVEAIQVGLAGVDQEGSHPRHK
jgi:hypothetical protein